jgi:hypothetical protein
VSMNVTPSSIARRAIPIAVDRFSQAGSPVSRMAPNPSRWTGRSPPMVREVASSRVSTFLLEGGDRVSPTVQPGHR